MKVELKKEVKEDGEVWFKVFIDDVTNKCFMEHREEQAKAYFEGLKNIKPFTPGVTLIDSFEIDNTPTSEELFNKLDNKLKPLYK